MTKYKNNELRYLLDITGALADKTRIRILAILDLAELCVCQITAALNLAPSTISKHLSIMEEAGLIQRRKSGRWVYYRPNNETKAKPVEDALKLVQTAVIDSREIAQDKKRTQALLREDINVVCQRLYRGQVGGKRAKDIKNGTRSKA